MLERRNHAGNRHAVRILSRRAASLTRELHCLACEPGGFVFESRRPDAIHVFEAVEKVEVSAAVQLERIRFDDIGPGGEIIEVDLAHRLGVLLDSVTAPINSAAENLGADSAVEKDRLSSREFSLDPLVAHARVIQSATMAVPRVGRPRHYKRSVAHSARGNLGGTFRREAPPGTAEKYRRW